MPTLKEGYSEIQSINFVPGPFVNEKDEQAYNLLS
jgi:hypothetical protein